MDVDHIAMTVGMYLILLNNCRHPILLWHSGEFHVPCLRMTVSHCKYVNCIPQTMGHMHKLVDQCMHGTVRCQAGNSINCSYVPQFTTEFYHAANKQYTCMGECVSEPYTHVIIQ